MKEEIWGWVQEFVLLEDPPEALFLCRLLQILPHSSSSPRLNKTLILRQLLSDLPQISPETLHSLQLLQKFDPNPNPNPDLLRSAYLHAAVGATFSSPNFRDAVEEIWVRNAGDLSEELADWKRRMETAGSKEEAMEGWDERRAADAVREYARAELDAMGPSLLVRLAEYLKAEREAAGTTTVAGRVKKRKAGSSSVSKHILTPEVQKVRDALIRSSKALQNVVEDPLTSAREVADSLIPHNLRAEAGIHVEEPRESPGPSEDNYNMVDKSPQAHPVDDAADDIHTEKRTKRPNDATKATLSHNMVDKSAQLHPVDDTSDDIHTEKRTKRPNDATKATLNHNMVDKSAQMHPVDDTAVNIHTEKRTKRPDDAIKPTLMDRNPSARTYEWEDDSIGSSKEGTAQSKKLHLRTPRTNPPSMPKDVETNITAKSAKGRKRRKWTPLEEDDLRKAVEKYGPGKWKIILDCCPENFEGRTQIDLKDKWRNMTK